MKSETWKRTRIALIALLGALVLVYWASALSFFPVPWPDDSAFYLAGMDWIHWPSHYRMHSQAPWVLSYDQANYNTMPALPLVMGVFSRLGAGVHAIRLFGMLGLGIWLALLLHWGGRERRPWVFLLALAAAATSPIIRWAAIVTRPEIWEGIFLLLLLIGIERDEPLPVARRYSWERSWHYALLLAGAAYVHFEAVIWVPAFLLGTFPWGRGRLRKGWADWGSFLFRVGGGALLLLSPWIFYVLAHPSRFAEQMRTQFHRMAGKHLFVDSAYTFFHSLYLGIGNPIDYPKYFNSAKVLLFALMAVAACAAVFQAWKRSEGRGLRLAALAAFAASIALWLDKYEIWFIGLIHLSFWPLWLTVSPRLTAGRRLRAYSVAATLAAIVIVQGAMSVSLERQASARMSWSSYRRWIDCIEGEIGPRRVVWQPNWPDALVELASRDPERDYYRAVDFPGVDERIQAVRDGMQAVIHSLLLQKPEEFARYHGEPRPQDVYYLTDYPWLLDKKYSWIRHPEKGTVRVCQEGPFWAALSLNPIPAPVSGVPSR